MRLLLFSIFLLLNINAFAQQRLIKGRITDSTFSVSIIGAAILTPDAKTFISGDSGIFYLHMDSSLLFFTVIHPDYESKIVRLNGSENYLVGLGKLKTSVAISGKHFSVNSTSIGAFDLEPRRMIRRNNYEGWRLGIVMNTNSKFSRHLELAANYAYGLKDRAHKYGAGITLRLLPADTLNLKFNYSSDVAEQGEVVFRQYKPENMEPYRQANINYMDRVITRAASLNMIRLKNLKAELFLNLISRQVSSPYSFSEKFISNFNVTESGLAMRYAFRENAKRVKNALPVIYLEIKKGITKLNGDYDYLRFDLKVTQKINLGRAGVTKIQLRAGKINGVLPLGFLYNMRSNYGNTFSFYSVNSFETMRMSEFFSDRYACLNFNHCLGKLLLKKKYSSPEFTVVTNVALGDINHREMHKNIDFKRLNKGYYESGALITSSINGLNAVFGLGGFYRYGPYSLNSFSQNFSGKLYLALMLK